MGHFTANEKACFEVMYAHSARVNNRKRVVVIYPNSRLNNEPFYLQCTVDDTKKHLTHKARIALFRAEMTEKSTNPTQR